MSAIQHSNADAGEALKYRIIPEIFPSSFNPEACILLTVDDADTAVRIEKMLRPQFQVIPASNLEEIQLGVRKNRPDLVLAASTMADLICSHHMLQELPVVLLHPLAEQPPGHALSADAVTPGELIVCIRAHLEICRLRENFRKLLKESRDEAKRQQNRFESMTQTLEERVRERTEELQRRAEKLHLLALELSNAEDRERRKIGMILHDDLQQYLAALRYKLWNLLPRRIVDEDVKRRIADFEQLIDESIQKCRSLSHELSPPVLHQGGLFAALEWLARDVGTKHGLRVNLRLNSEAEFKSPALSSFLFRSVREILFNVAKHAGTDTATVEAISEDKTIRIVVRDNGKGFDTAAVKERRGRSAGFGLFSIEERLTFLGGRLEIESKPKQGCCVSLIVPIDRVHQLHVQENYADYAPLSGGIENAGQPALSNKIRILLADDHAVMRQGLANLLEGEEELKVVGHAENGLQAIQLARELNPDMILMDVSMPKKDGIKATAEIVKRQPNIRIIGLSMHNDPATREKMMKAGASAYIYKAAPAQKLIETILSVRLGSS